MPLRSSPTVAPDIKAVAPITESSEALTAGTSNWTTTVVGSTPSWITVRGETLAQGRFLDNQDVSDHEPVVVLGSVTASELFSRGDPVGQTVDVDGLPLTVVGVLNSVGSSTSSSTTSDPDDTAVVPLTTAAEQIFGGHIEEHAELDHRAGPLLRRPDGGVSGGRSRVARAPRHHDGGRRGLHHHLPSVEVSTATSVDRTLTILSGRGRRNFPARRRYRRHEHHAGLGHRENPRDRTAQGARGHSPA